MKWTGMGKLMGDLLFLKDNYKDKIRHNVRKHASNLQAKEMRTVPVDTGFLKRSITLTVKDEGMTAEVEPMAHYASYVEYGTRKMAAHPYIRPNFEVESAEFIRDMREIIPEFMEGGK